MASLLHMTSFVVFLLVLSFSTSNGRESLPNSCENLSDGMHWLKLMDGDVYPAVYLRCSNGYTVLDFSKDNNIKSYFTSWSEWHVGTFGPSNDYSINWQDWFLPDTTYNPKSGINFNDNTYYKSEDSTSLTTDSDTDSDSDSDINNSVNNNDGPISNTMDYLISPDCTLCEEDSVRQLYSKSTTYWMTGTLYGCFWATKGAHNCDVDWDTDECFTCRVTNTTVKTLVDQGHTRQVIDDYSSKEDFDVTGICPHNVRASNHYVPLTHDQCSHDEGSNKLHLKPSIGVKGKNCVCVKPKNGYNTYYEINEIPDSPLIHTKEDDDDQEISNLRRPGSNNNNNNNDNDNSNSENIKDNNEESDLKTNDINDEETMDVFYLYQSDFARGTFRIRESGKYIIMEDIIFDYGGSNSQSNDEMMHGMNSKDDKEDIYAKAGVYDSAKNGVYEYWPSKKDEFEYPGASQGRDPYFLGFFAGITIECNNVIIELNDHTLQMSEHFYYQQRWFTTIELTTQYFLPGQGIGNFGANPKVSENVIIRNGVLGLTSHHGIHGNYNSNIYLLNLQIRDFETHGIQFNGFNNINLKSIEIGPTSTKSYFSGEYGHMRALLPRLKAISLETLDEEIQFYGRDSPTTLNEITDEIQRQLDMAFDYIVHGKTYTKENVLYEEIYESYESMLKLFINPSGIPYGGAMYGIFLNTFGASVFTYNLYTGFYSSNANLEDITIHDMQHEMKEYVRLFRPNSGDIIINPFNGPLNAEELFVDMEDSMNGFKYKGNIVTDAYIAMNYLTDNWDYLGMQLILNSYVTPWALGKNFDIINDENTAFGCNSDVMIHSGKGINGLRLDGVKNVNIENINIYNLHDYTGLGSEKCGEYDDLECPSCGYNGGHFRQTKPMQIGFSGNMNQAININAAIDINIENVNINGVYSDTGPSFGISIWPACDVTLKGDIFVENLASGLKIENNKFTYDDRPNKAPETCGVRVYWQYGDYSTNVNYNDANIINKCMTGHVGCLGDDITKDNDYSSLTILGNVDTNLNECNNAIFTNIDNNNNNNNNNENSLLNKFIDFNNIWKNINEIKILKNNKTVFFGLTGVIGILFLYFSVLSCFCCFNKLTKLLNKTGKRYDGYEKIKEIRKEKRSVSNSVTEASALL